jgi:hypothetical protein
MFKDTAMPATSPLLRRAALALWAASATTVAAAAEPAAPANAGLDVATLERIRDAAMTSDYSWKRLADLSDKIGPRLRSEEHSLNSSHNPASRMPSSA